MNSSVSIDDDINIIFSTDFNITNKLYRGGIAWMCLFLIMALNANQPHST